jgi:hypothetical protein
MGAATGGNPVSINLQVTSLMSRLAAYHAAYLDASGDEKLSEEEREAIEGAIDALDHLDDVWRG